jgi:hypothetical protein
MLRSWDVTRALRHYRLGVQVSTGFMTSWGDLQDAIDLLVDIVRAGGALRIFRMRSSLASRTTVATWWVHQWLSRAGAAPSQAELHVSDGSGAGASVADRRRLLREIRLAAEDVDHGDQPGRKEDRDVPMWPR